MSFEQLNLSASIIKALETEGYTNPTPIQQQAIPVILNRKDILGCAQTGTGKTAAFALPVLHQLEQQPAEKGKKRDIRALILCPTRELAIQINDSFTAYGKHTGLRHQVVFGGVSINAQINALKIGADILIATPGRLVDLLNQRVISLKKVRHFILDEADRMLDMGFIRDIKKVIEVIPTNRQTLFFSATMPPEIASLANSILNNPTKIEVAPVSSTAEKVTQAIYEVDKKDKASLLIHLLQDKAMQSVLVFTRTKHGADKLVKILTRANIKSDAIHGNKAQNARQKALSNFKEGRIRVLVATDIASRGIDIDDLKHVVNYDLPEQAETYVHRIGRTGRAGNEGIAISFCSAEEQDLLKDINKVTAQKIPFVTGHPYPMDKSARPLATQPENKKSQAPSRKKVFKRREKRSVAAA
ncbi:DEAD/DEAH box helicase [Desertivirga brevis]|uniref:DEAD/DEAH box helicase n=1 Tax=Desertivirga brevis TaxID=2810310 RepID=UPI001A96106A|nr:DEAD/DEAH box helicase [Pedobacter sp. SYSU D00873]